MGGGIARHGFKSGVLPATRRILKHPTIKQTDLVDRAKEPAITGPDGTGYSSDVREPPGSLRVPPVKQFIDVEEIIKKTIPKSTREPKLTTQLQKDKQIRAELRQKYLSEALRNEESRILKRSELLKKKLEIKKLEREKELELINRKKSSDLTIPSLENLINQPLVRARSKEEKKLLDLKRKYNRELLDFNNNERKLEKLLGLYYVASEFIVTEEQLMRRLDNLIPIRKISNSEEIKKMNVENKLGDELFGLINGRPGLPVVKEYLNNEDILFAERIERANGEVNNQTNNNNNDMI